MFFPPVSDWLDMIRSSAGVSGLLVSTLLIVSLGLVPYVGLFMLLRRQAKFLSSGQILWNYVYWPGLLAVGLLILRGCLPMFLPYLGARGMDGLQHILALCLVVALTALSIRVVNATREILLHVYHENEAGDFRNRKIRTQLLVIERVLIFLIILAGIAFALMTFDSIRLLGQGLLASAGVIGIILGFAAQRTISTIIAGVQIALAQPIRINDVVIVEGEWGKIEEITLTYVVVAVWDQRRVILPITYFIDKPFQNWTRTSTELLGTVFLYADYRLPIDPLREELKRVLDGSELWDGRVSQIVVTEAGQSSMQLRALVSARDASSAWDLRCIVREKLIDFIRSNYPEYLPRTRVQLEASSQQEGRPGPDLTQG